jgi:uncharacterized membrane protein (UPF0127 family)
VRLVHDPPEGDSSVLATEVEFADGVLSKARGLTFRRSIPDDYALVFRFAEARTRRLHMLFVAFPIDAVWLVEGEVTAVARLRPWTGYGTGEADTVVELPAGAADRVLPGDRIELRERSDPPG